MNTKSQVDKRPVPLEKHYEVFKSIEDKLKTHLGGLDHEYYFTGLRVAYDLQDSSNEPNVLPYAVEFGNLGWLDLAIKCNEPVEISDEELKGLAKNTPISIDLLDDLYEYANAELQAASAEKLSVGVYIVLNGSSPKAYARTCTCRSGSVRRRLRSVPTILGGPPGTYCGKICP